VFRRVRKGEKYAMKGYAEKLSKQLMALVGKVRARSLACSGASWITAHQ